MTHVEDTLKCIDVMVLKYYSLNMCDRMMIKLHTFFATTL